jgi:hypothetical protein
MTTDQPPASSTTCALEGYAPAGVDDHRGQRPPADARGLAPFGGVKHLLHVCARVGIALKMQCGHGVLLLVTRLGPMGEYVKYVTYFIELS